MKNKSLQNTIKAVALLASWLTLSPLMLILDRRWKLLPKCLRIVLFVVSPLMLLVLATAAIRGYSYLSGLNCNSKQGNTKQIDNRVENKPSETREDCNYKDSLWTIFSESPDEIEVERARERLYEMASQADWNMLVEKDYEKYKAQVEAEFQLLLSALPEYTGLFLKEKEKWDSYNEAVLAMISLEDHGSSGTLNIIGALNQSVDLWNASFHNLWLYKQKQDASFPQTKFTSQMIDDAYSLFFNVAIDNWYNPYTKDHQEGIEEYKESITNEMKAWNEWMKYRTTVAKALSKDMFDVYNGCTNLTMRLKLLQLKNQNAGLGLMSDYVSSCLLPDTCSDTVLLDYPGLNVVLEKH